MNTKEGEVDTSKNRDAVKNILTNTQTDNYKQLNNTQDLNNAWILPIKIELADEDLNALHEKLTNFLKRIKAIRQPNIFIRC